MVLYNWHDVCSGEMDSGIGIRTALVGDLLVYGRYGIWDLGFNGWSGTRVRGGVHGCLLYDRCTIWRFL